MPTPNQNKNQVKKQINLQDEFIEKVRSERIQVTIHLVNGFQLKGIIAATDNFTILLKDSGKEILVYKHSITTIQPSKPSGII